MGGDKRLSPLRVGVERKEEGKKKEKKKKRRKRRDRERSMGRAAVAPAAVWLGASAHSGAQEGLSRPAITSWIAADRGLPQLLVASPQRSGPLRRAPSVQAPAVDSHQGPLAGSVGHLLSIHGCFDTHQHQRQNQHLITNSSRMQITSKTRFAGEPQRCLCEFDVQHIQLATTSNRRLSCFWPRAVASGVALLAPYHHRSRFGSGKFTFFFLRPA